MQMTGVKREKSDNTPSMQVRLLSLCPALLAETKTLVEHHAVIVILIDVFKLEILVSQEGHFLGGGRCFIVKLSQSSHFLLSSLAEISLSVTVFCDTGSLIISAMSAMYSIEINSSKLET